MRFPKRCEIERVSELAHLDTHERVLFAAGKHAAVALPVRLDDGDGYCEVPATAIAAARKAAPRSDVYARLETIAGGPPSPGPFTWREALDAYYAQPGPEYSIVLDVRLLTDVARAVGAHTTHLGTPVRLTVRGSEPGAVLVEAYRDDNGALAILMPIR